MQILPQIRASLLALICDVICKNPRPPNSQFKIHHSQFLSGVFRINPHILVAQIAAPSGGAFIALFEIQTNSDFR